VKSIFAGSIFKVWTKRSGKYKISCRISQCSGRNICVFRALKFRIGEFRRSDSAVYVRLPGHAEISSGNERGEGSEGQERGTLCWAPGRPATSKRSRYFPSELLSARRAPPNNSMGEKSVRINGNFPFKMRNG